MTTPVEEQPEEQSWAVFPGRDANFIFSRMRELKCPGKLCALKWLRIHLHLQCGVSVRSMFNAPDRKTAEELLQAAIQKYAVSATRLSAWMEDNIAEGFTVFDFPLEHRRSIRTTISMERVNKEIRRRTRVVGVFPNEASCLRLVSAPLMETSGEWQIGKHYCAVKPLNC
jgi:putative transposase